MPETQPRTSRQRVRTVLDHREADRVPMDFDATAVTGMHATCVAALRQHYGLPDHPVSITEPYQMLGDVEPDLRDALGIDTATVRTPSNMFGMRNERWKPWRACAARSAYEAADLPSASANLAWVPSAFNHSAFTSTGLPTRGVTTQSPTLASIQVSCTPGSPA